MFYHSITEFAFLMNILWKRSDLPCSRKKEKSTVSFTHVQNIICSQTQLDGIAHEQTIICRQLFPGHVVGFRPMKRKKRLLRTIIKIIAPPTPYPTRHLLFLLSPPCQVEVESDTSKLISDDSISKINLGTKFGAYM